MPSRLAIAVTTWRTYRHGRFSTQLPVVACASAAIPAEAARRLDAFTAPLCRAGFVHALDCGPRDARAAVINHCRVFSHPGERIRAWVMDLQSSHAGNTFVEVATRFADGSVVGTINPTTPPIFERPPWLAIEVLAGAPVDELLASHRARVAAVDMAPIAPWDEDPLGTAERENQAVLEYQAERGILTSRDGEYGYTGRGAARSVNRIARGE